MKKYEKDTCISATFRRYLNGHPNVERMKIVICKHINYVALKTCVIVSRCCRQSLIHDTVPYAFVGSQLF